MTFECLRPRLRTFIISSSLCWDQILHRADAGALEVVEGTDAQDPALRWSSPEPSPYRRWSSTMISAPAAPSDRLTNRFRCSVSTRATEKRPPVALIVPSVQKPQWSACRSRWLSQYGCSDINNSPEHGVNAINGKSVDAILLDDGLLVALSGQIIAATLIEGQPMTSLPPSPRLRCATRFRISISPLLLDA